MADAEKPFLRIYCLCGQKMKVTGALFGRPGKCVACRQKIRVPRLEEVPEGVDTIHLKDHPEYLRSTPRKTNAPIQPNQQDVVLRMRGEDEPATPEPDDEAVELGEESDKVPTVALDILEPLRNLYSLEYKLTRELKTLSKNDSIHAEVEGRLAKVQDIHHDLDEQLRQMLMEVAIELATTHDKIAQTQLSARIGEVGFDEFKKETYRQRSRRDRLERRQLDLRGWLATNNLSLAGGFVDVPPDSIPDDGFTVHVPEPPATTAPLVDVHTTALRDAFERRAVSERKVAEIDRMRRDGDSQSDWQTERGNAKSDLLFADANIHFCQERLTQLQSDYNEDLETISAQADFVRARMQSGQMERAEYDKLDKKLVRARTDLKKALSIVDRALGANSARDVPHPRGTFLDRMAAAEREPGTIDPIENWLAWGAAGLLAMSLVLPLVGNASLLGSFVQYQGSGHAGHWSFLLMLVFVAGIVGASAITEERARIAVFSLLVAFGLFLFVVVTREALYSIGPVSARFRSGPPILIRPGTIAIVLAALGVLASIALTSRRIDWWPAAPAGTVVAALALMFFATTDFAGARRPDPAVSVSLKDVAGGRGQLAQVRIANNGGRTVHILPDASEARAVYQLFIERKVGENSWAEVAMSEVGGRSNVRTVGGGEHAVISVSLSPGDYRAQLIGTAAGKTVQASFNVPERAPAVVEASPEPKPEPEVAIEAIPEPIPPRLTERPEEPAYPEVEFRGAGAGAEGNYRLSFVVYYPSGEEERMFVSRGQELPGGWRVSGYDAVTSRVSLSRAGEVLTLSPGQFETLMP